VSNQFAIIEIADSRSVPADAIATGPLDYIMAGLAGNAEAMFRAECAEKRAEAAEQQQAQQEKQVALDVVHALAKGLADVGRRLDAVEQSRRERRRLDALSEATEQQLEIPKDAPDPDAPSLDPKAAGDEIAPAPGSAILGPPEPHSVEAEEQQHDAEGDLPRELQAGTPPQSGTDPVVDPAELSHPQTSEQRSPPSASLW
jgi:hypothetical protein